VGDDELPLADRRPAGRGHTGAGPVRPPLARHAEGGVLLDGVSVGGNARLVTGDALTEITRLKAEEGGPMDVGGATLAAAAIRAGLVDEYVLVTHPVLVGGGTPFFTALDTWVSLDLVETRTFPGGLLLTRYETRR
jgi:dihydrofolate reductase